MDAIAAPSDQAAVERLLAVLPLLAPHDPDLVDLPARVDAVTRLSRVRYRHLAEIDEVIGRQRIPEIRVDLLLGYHQIVLMWMRDLVGRPVEAAEFEDLDRAVFDTVAALLLWHVVNGFHRTQRLVQLCLLELQQRAQRVSSHHTSETMP